MTQALRMNDERRCALHPIVTASFTCDRCGNFGCQDCAAPECQRARCSACFAREPSQIPWETSGRALITGYCKTLWLCLRHPHRTFGEQTTSNTQRAAAFGLVTVVIATLLYDIGRPHPEFVLQQTAAGMVRVPARPYWLMFLVSLVMHAVAAVGHACLWTLATHVVARRGTPLSLSLRLACYCLAPLPLVVVFMHLPYVGVLANLVAFAYLAIYGAACRSHFGASPWLLAPTSVVASCFGAAGFLFTFLYCLPLVAKVVGMRGSP
jgi:hypothetical protein